MIRNVSHMQQASGSNNIPDFPFRHGGSAYSKDPENALWKHCILEHESEEAEFSMKVLDTFQSSMARQVNEGVRIKRSKADCLMNSKSEFHQHPVVRVVPMRGLQQEQCEDQGSRAQGQRQRNPLPKMMPQARFFRINPNKNLSRFPQCWYW